ncbi:DUF1501 domain-containing protein [Alteromonas oceanisediminis]|uniref:DUF1501 domain-containing protein n=1 Tax=Alteromonas oceanisediminis TaxID=2836180 RepID=UPI001BD9E67A|nr:DUF1501 domain-containing protein [Alteromonas oceanisediminis]MBT0586267.1 DUF1501 domain-containing protein [Alteromonas oceanisediminis]
MMTSRRQFLQRACLATASMGCYSALGLQLNAFKAMASQARFSDHKALVCVFLYGGNDSFNMLIPTGSEAYAAYQTTRQGIAYPREGLIPIDLSLNDLPAHSMPRAMAPLAELFNTQRLSVVSNIGPLVEPATKQQLKADPNKLPPQLFSHNSQQALWQTAGINTQLGIGWLGLMADLLQDTQTNLPINISVGSSDILNSGVLQLPLVLNPNGPQDFARLNPSNTNDQQRIQAHQQLLALDHSPLTQEYARRITTARDNNEVLKQALSAAPPRTVNYPENNTLANQLRMVADMIAVQSSLQQSRQVFFVGLGGWDTHDNQPEQHPALLATLAEALSAFNTDIDALNKADNVTTVTLSDFGRTLTSNRDGTDHGWAGHQLVIGGAVRGGRIIGHLPEQRLNTQDDWDDGRIIPTTSIEQLAAALGAWFGLTDSELTTVLPNLNRFDATALQLFRSS